MMRMAILAFCFLLLSPGLLALAPLSQEGALKDPSKGLWQAEECAPPPPYVHPLSFLEALSPSITMELDPAMVGGAVMEVDTTEFKYDGQIVNVTWSGILYPATGDIVALYSPADADPQKTAPVEILNANQASGGQHLASGSGSASFRLINLRQATYGFKLIKIPNGPTSPTIVVASPSIRNLIPARPSQGHLIVLPPNSTSSAALNKGPHGGATIVEVMVKWISANPPSPSPSNKPPAHTPQMVIYTISGDKQQPGQGAVVGGTVEAELMPSLYSRRAESIPVTYGPQNLCGFPAQTFGWLDPGVIHSAVISIPPGRASAGSVVTYRYGSAEVGWSASRSFLVPPPTTSSSSSSSNTASSVTRRGKRLLQGARKHQEGGVDAAATDMPLRFLAFNDVGMTNAVLFINTCPPYCPAGPNFSPAYTQNSSKLPQYLEKEEAHLALMIGDLSYALGYAADWDYFGEQFENSFTKWPMAIGMGNHERDWPGTGDVYNVSKDSGGECGVAAAARYLPPGATRDYYTFDMGPVHFLVLNSELPSDPTSEQGMFVAADLPTVDRSRTPWVVVGLHRMMWAPATYRNPPTGDLDVEERLQRDFEGLFKEWGVDVVVHGHEHAYARTCKLYQGACVDQAPVYLLAGHAGAGFTHGFPSVLPPWVVSSAQNRNGYLRFQATRTTMIMEAVSTDDGSVMDTMTLQR